MAKEKDLNVCFLPIIKKIRKYVILSSAELFYNSCCQTTQLINKQREQNILLMKSYSTKCHQNDTSAMLNL